MTVESLFFADKELPELDPWKPCDLRGNYPDAVSPSLFRNIGSAVGTLLPPSSHVLVAGDFRLSTPELKRALCDGLLQTGAHILDAGQGPTPLAYFAAQRMNAGAVLIVTASHNPAAHNGLKLMLGSAPMTPPQLAEIRALATARTFRTGQGATETVDLRSRYIETILRRWTSPSGSKQTKLVLDAGNGAWSELAPAIFQRLGYDLTCISCIADGNFPDRSPDCARSSNLTQLRATVRQQGNTIGIAWDGDGDRVAFVDEDGMFVSPDEIALLMAEAVLDGRASTAADNGRIVVDVKCSAIVRRWIETNRGTPLLERTGHAFMRARMVDSQALLGLDACGHYFFRELNGGDDGVFAALFVLDLLRRKGLSLAQLRRGLPPIFATPELRISTNHLSYARAAKALTAAFPNVRILEIDGFNFELSHGSILLRESGTESVLSLTIEGFDAASHEHIRTQCLQALPEIAALFQAELQHEDAGASRHNRL
jgi:phosphomannomutase / phosphoglucomutase